MPAVRRAGHPASAVRAAIIFVAEIDRSGQIYWARGMGGPGHDAVTAVRVSPSGTASITGNVESAINIGTSMVRAAGANSGFMARFAM